MAEKKSQVNRGIKKGVDTELFKDHVICTKCGKDVEFTLESQLFVNCPRCGKKLERNLKKETAEGKQVIREDIKRRGKGAILSFASFLTFVGLIYLGVALFTGLIADNWLFAMIPLPLFIISLITTIMLKKSVSLKVRLGCKIMFIINIVLIAAAVAVIFDPIREFLPWVK